MKKLNLFLAFFFSVVFVDLQTVKAAEVWEIFEVTATSGNILSGGATVKAVWLSSPTSFGTQWAVLVDSFVPNGSSGILPPFGVEAMKMPPLTFSTGSVNTLPNYNYIDFEDGIYFSTQVALYKSDANSGLALRAYIKAKRGMP